MEKTMRIPIVLSLAIAAMSQFPTQAAAQQGGGASINKVQEREIFDQTTRVYNDRKAPTSAFKDQCTGVLGLAAYCGCLGKDMPAGVGFDNFVVVLTRTKQENGYDKLDATSKRAYDAIPALRDRCAAEVAKP
jgi:hypothetical protein